MQACIHRGSKQIGGSCVEVENNGLRLLIDFGLPLDAEENNRQYLPSIAGLDGSDPSLLGILISHPHLDHYGLLAQIPPALPVGMGTAARQILEAAAPFMSGKCPTPRKGWDYISGHTIEVGPFRVTPFLVDHSAYDAYSFLIESGGKSFYYSGDFRAHGRKAALFDYFIAHPPTNIDALLLEGTSIGRIGDDQIFATEREIEEKLVQLFSNTKGLALVHTSSQNIDRIVTIMRASKRTGRKLVIDLYTAAILEATGNEHIPQSSWPEVALFVPQSQRIKIKKNAWFELLKHHSAHRIYIEQFQEAPQNFTLLFRPLHIPDLERGLYLAGASYIYSQWEGYWDRGEFDEIKAWLNQQSIPRYSIHTSGHASPADLKKFVAAINPRKVIPIHSFMPERYPELFPNVEMHHDDEWWEV